MNPLTLDTADAPPAAPRPAGRRRGAAIFALLAGWLLLMLVGVALVNGGVVASSGGELPGDYAVFAVVNAATLTGFQKDVSVDLSPIGRASGPIFILTLTVASTLVFLIAGSMAVARVARLGYSDRQIAVAAFTVTALAVVAGAIPLADRGLVPALLGAASAFGNGGLFVGSPPGVLSWKTHAVLMPLALVGGLGLPVLMEGFDRLIGRRKHLSTHSKTVLVGSAAVYLLAVVALFAFQAIDGDGSWRRMAASASVQSINSRSAGFPLEYLPVRAVGVQVTLVVLMILGAGGPGGTGGGLKISTLARIGHAVNEFCLGRPLGRGAAFALAWLASFLLLLLGGFWLLSLTAPHMAADRLLFIVISAVSNVGLSHDSIALTDTPLRILTALMLLGRVVPLLLLAWLAAIHAEEGVVPG
jgi:Trk-type K+ transport system membrane component